MKIPRLRFPEFQGEWNIEELWAIADKVTQKNRDESLKYVLSNSAVEWIVSQESYFDRDIANENNLGNYYVVSTDDFVYNPRISSTAPVWPIKRNHLSRWVMSPLYSVFRFKKGNLDFFEFFFETSYWNKYLEWIANSWARHDRINVTTDGFYKMPMPFPDAPEQQKIASFLSVVDEKIEKLKTKKSLLEQYKKGVMQKIFSMEMRFQDWSGGEFPEWKETRLEELWIFYRWHSYQAENVIPERWILVLRSSNIKDNILVFDDLQFVNKSCPEEIRLIKNDIVICMANGSKSLVGKMAQYDGDYAGEITVWAFCSIFRSNNVLVKYLFQTNCYKKFLRTSLAWTNINNLKNSDLEQLSFSLPSSETEQQQIATFLFWIDRKIDAASMMIESVEKWKNGLLQMMFV